MSNFWLRAEQRRQIIIDAAIRVARRDGLAATSIPAVARECDITTSERTVRRMFGRGELWCEIIRREPSLVNQAKNLGL